MSPRTPDTPTPDSSRQSPPESSRQLPPDVSPALYRDITTSRSSESLTRRDHANARAAAIIEICLIIASGGWAVWMGWLAWRAEAAPGMIVLWCTGIAAVGLSARWPQVGLYSYIAVVHGTPRYLDDYAVLFEIGAPHALCLLAALGWAVWMSRSRRRWAVSDRLSRVMGLFIIWLIVAATAAWVRGQSWQPHVKHDPIMYLHGLVLFVIASHVLIGATASCQLAALLGATVCLRGLYSGGEGIHLEADIAALAVMSLPLTLIGVRFAKSRWLTGAFLFLAMLLLGLVAYIQNRGAAVGFVATLVVLWLHLRHKWRIFLAAAPVAVLVAVMFASTGYWQRFAGIWQGTDDRNSVIERLEIWQAGWEMFLDHPLLGVGPGNYHNVVDRYGPQSPSERAAHNNFVQVLAETGAVGLVLYCLLLGGALASLGQVASVAGPDWPGGAARMLMASIVAYLVIGLFISRQDMALAYLFVGWAAAIRADWLGRHDPGDGARITDDARGSSSS